MSEDQKQNGIDQLISDDMWIYDFSMICKGVIYSKEVNDSEFRTYCVIRSLVNLKKEVAWPSVETIAELSGHSTRTARRNIARLEQMDLIKRIPRNGSSNYYMVKKLQNSSVLRNEQDIQEWMDSHAPKQPEPKKPEPPGEEPGKKDDHVPYKLIMDHLNFHAGTKFNHTGQANQKLIKARYNELKKAGFNHDEIIQEFKNVIEVKTMQWANTDMAQYLRPSTLFGNKFDQYRNESPNKKTPGQIGQAPSGGDWKQKFLEGDDE